MHSDFYDYTMLLSPPIGKYKGLSDPAGYINIQKRASNQIIIYFEALVAGTAAAFSA